MSTRCFNTNMCPLLQCECECVLVVYFVCCTPMSCGCRMHVCVCDWMTERVRLYTMYRVRRSSKIIYMSNRFHSRQLVFKPIYIYIYSTHRRLFYGTHFVVLHISYIYMNATFVVYQTDQFRRWIENDAFRLVGTTAKRPYKHLATGIHGIVFW